MWNDVNINSVKVKVSCFPDCCSQLSRKDLEFMFLGWTHRVVSQEAVGEEIQLKPVEDPLHGGLYSFWEYEGFWPSLTSLSSEHKAFLFWHSRLYHKVWLKKYNWLLMFQGYCDPIRFSDLVSHWLCVHGLSLSTKKLYILKRKRGKGGEQRQKVLMYKGLEIWMIIQRLQGGIKVRKTITNNRFSITNKDFQISSEKMIIWTAIFLLWYHFAVIIF